VHLKKWLTMRFATTCSVRVIDARPPRAHDPGVTRIRNIWTRLTRKQKVLIFVLVFVVMPIYLFLGNATVILILILFFSAVYAGVWGAGHNWVRRRYDEWDEQAKRRR
jgi:purine-cytosine permease-like protein